MRVVARAVVVLAVLAAPLGAEQVWKKVDYSEWEEKTAQRILTDSPWATQVRLKGLDQVTLVPAGMGEIRNEQPTQDVVRLVWWSARAPRQATVRLAELNGTPLTEEQAERLLDPEPTETLQVRMESEGPLVALAATLSEEELKKSARLDVHGRNWQLHAQQAEVIKDTEGRPRQIIFHFPRIVSGVSLIGPMTKRAEFHWRLPKHAAPGLERVLRFNVTFHFGRMKLRNQQDW